MRPLYFNNGRYAAAYGLPESLSVTVPVAPTLGRCPVQSLALILPRQSACWSRFMLYLNIANAVLCKTEALLQTGHLPSQVRHIEGYLKPIIYSEMHNKVLRRCCALSYYLYCLRLRALYLILHSTI